MKHWHWISLVFLAVVLAVVALAVPRLGGGPEKGAAQVPLVVSLDMDTSDGPCTDIDASASHGTGETYDVAICATGLYNGPGFGIGSFQFDVLYNDSLNAGTEVADAGTALDDNPDANENEYGDGLGSGWACDNTSLAFPKGDKNPLTGPGNGDAFIACNSLTGPYTLGDNETAGVIAVIEFTAISGGDDSLTIEALGYLAYPDASKMGTCLDGDDYPMACTGGTDNKTGSTATPTPITPTPTPTNTPVCGGAEQPTCTPTPTRTATRKAWTYTPSPTATGTAAPSEPSGPSEPQQPPPPPPTGGQLPQVVPPGTGSGPDGIPWAGTAVWLLAAAGAVSVSLGGLYLRRARRR